MLHQLLQLLPGWIMQAAPIALASVGGVGVLLWLMGGCFSRMMLCSLAVTTGSWVGVRLPHVFGWPIEPRFVGTFGAIVLAAAAYLFHRTLVRIALGNVAALWAVTAAWIKFDGANQWHPANLNWTGNLTTYAPKLWHSFPGHLGIVIPYASSAGMAAGVLTALLWPTFARCLLYSLIGTTLILGTGLPLTARLRPAWLDMAPATAQAQLLIVLAFVAIGAAVQLWLCLGPRAPRLKSAASKGPFRKAARRPTIDHSSGLHAEESGASGLLASQDSRRRAAPDRSRSESGSASLQVTL